MSARVVTALSIVFVLLTLLTAIQPAVAQSANTANKSQIAHGEYLVKGIAGCPDCHTPMNEKGEFVPGQWLKGTKLTFGPLVKFPAWADTAPNIAGLEGWDAEKAVQLLMTGKDPSGQPPRLPMPQYHMNHGDAAAVVAYLKSLK